MNVFDTSPADWGLLIARVCIATPFLVSGVHKAVWYRKAAAEFRDAAVPLIAVTLPATILLHILGSLCLIADVYGAGCRCADRLHAPGHGQGSWFLAFRG